MGWRETSRRKTALNQVAWGQYQRGRGLYGRCEWTSYKRPRPPFWIFSPNSNRLHFKTLYVPTGISHSLSSSHNSLSSVTNNRCVAGLNTVQPLFFKDCNQCEIHSQSLLSSCWLQNSHISSSQWLTTLCFLQNSDFLKPEKNNSDPSWQKCQVF